MHAQADELIAQLTTALRDTLTRRGIDNPHVVGIHAGGVWVAERVHAALGLASPIGMLDISFHRDDYGRVGLNPSVRPSRLPWDIADKHVVLIDDVLYTGRTVRAALNELFDWGRPASVLLGVLIARDGRELPVEADAAGMRVALPPGQHVKLRGPEPLRLEWMSA